MSQEEQAAPVPPPMLVLRRALLTGFKNPYLNLTSVLAMVKHEFGTDVLDSLSEPGTKTAGKFAT